jgi:hypothetical protein
VSSAIITRPLRGSISRLVAAIYNDTAFDLSRFPLKWPTNDLGFFKYDLQVTVAHPPCFFLPWLSEYKHLETYLARYTNKNMYEHALFLRPFRKHGRDNNTNTRHT